MTRPASYDEDVYLWSLHQAEVLRRLTARRDLPNDLDLPNVIEEIESVGRSDLNAVRSHLAAMLVHLVKLVSSPAAEPVRLWKREVIAHRGAARRQFTPGMRKGIALADLWGDARADAAAELALYDEAPAPLPEECPFTLDELLDRDAPIDGLVARLAEASRRAVG
jgi:hypothetical protein